MPMLSAADAEEEEEAAPPLDESAAAAYSSQSPSTEARIPSTSANNGIVNNIYYFDRIMTEFL